MLHIRHMDLNYKGLAQLIGEDQATDFLLYEVFGKTPNRLKTDGELHLVERAI